MITPKSARKVTKKSSLTGKRARFAAKAAKKAYAKRASRSAAWKKGGREWARLLGHFGWPAEIRRRRGRCPATLIKSS